MTKDLDELRRLRGRAPTPWERPDTCEGSHAFYTAAHKALGPQGCVTKELERVDAYDQAFRVLEAERAALQAEVDRLHGIRADDIALLAQMQGERDALKRKLAKSQACAQPAKWSCPLPGCVLCGTPLETTR